MEDFHEVSGFLTDLVVDGNGKRTVIGTVENEPSTADVAFAEQVLPEMLEVDDVELRDSRDSANGRVSFGSTQAYRNNYDDIFRKDKAHLN